MATSDPRVLLPTSAMTIGLTAVLIVAIAAPVRAAHSGRAAYDPRQLQADRFTVVADRRADRLPELARRLRAMDLFLGRSLDVPDQRLSEPVVVAYLHRTSGLDKQLPFAGDRIGHEYLLPTERGLWVLIREDTGTEDLRPVVAQVAELALVRGAGEPPAWLRNGLYELLARVDLADGQLVLMPPPFADLHAAGLFRAPLADAAKPGWSRYQEPQRWYTSTLVVAFLLDTEPATLAAAIADPQGFDLLRRVDSDRFDAWVQDAVVRRWTGPAVLVLGVGSEATEPTVVDDNAMQRHIADLTLTHRRPGKLKALRKVDPLAEAWLELRAGAPGEACAAVEPRDDPRVSITRGLCLQVADPRAAEDAFLTAYRAEPGLIAQALHAAALMLDTPGREAEAAALVRTAVDTSPANGGARLLDAVLTVRAGEGCPTWTADAPGSIQPPWADIRYVAGPLQRLTPRFEREILECGN